MYHLFGYGLILLAFSRSCKSQLSNATSTKVSAASTLPSWTQITVDSAASDKDRTVVISEDFRKAVRVGDSMINQLTQDKGQQKNYTIQDLSKWGWRITENFTVDLPTSALGGFATYLAKLGSVEEQWNSGFMVKHELQYGNGIFWPVVSLRRDFD